MNACLGCVSGSYRFMRGCELCSQQTIARFQGTDEELIALFHQAQEDLKRSQESGCQISDRAMASAASSAPKAVNRTLTSVVSCFMIR